MTTKKTCVYTTNQESQSRSAFWAMCSVAFVALCLSMVLLTGCAQAYSNVNAGTSQPESIQAAAEQESLDPGFVIEDTAVVEVKIDGE